MGNTYCIDDPSDGRGCLEYFAVYRVTWALFLFHLSLGFSQIAVKDQSECRAQIHTSWWGLKLLYFVSLLVAAFLIPDSMFVVYGWFALAGAAVFILMQLLMLVDFAHTLNESWVRQYESTEDSKYTWYLGGTTGLCYVMAIVLTVLMYVYDMGPKTWVSPFLITLNLVFCLGISALSLLPTVQKADRSTPVGLLQASFVASYACYLVFAALMDNMEGSSAFQTTTSVLIGSAFVIICVGYTAVRISGHEETYFGVDSDREPMNYMIMDGEDEESPAKKVDVEEDKEAGKSGPIPYNYAFFHAVFAMGAMYVCMLMTSWALLSGSSSSSSSTDPSSTLHVDQGIASMWVKITMSWVMLLLYVWTLVGPIVLPDREW